MRKELVADKTRIIDVDLFDRTYNINQTKAVSLVDIIQENKDVVSSVTFGTLIYGCVLFTCFPLILLLGALVSWISLGILFGLAVLAFFGNMFYYNSEKAKNFAGWFGRSKRRKKALQKGNAFIGTNQWHETNFLANFKEKNAREISDSRVEICLVGNIYQKTEQSGWTIFCSREQKIVVDKNVINWQEKALDQKQAFKQSVQTEVKDLHLEQQLQKGLEQTKNQARLDKLDETDEVIHLLKNF